MSFMITDAFVQQFTGNVRFLAQQMDSRLRRTVIEDQITGESAYLEQLAPTAARKVIARHSDSPIMNTQHLRRRVAPYDYDWGDLVDQEDKVRLLIDPESQYAKNAGYAMNRGMDAQTLGPYYAQAMRAPGATPDSAFDAALKKAGQDGAFTAAGWIMFVNRDPSLLDATCAEMRESGASESLITIYRHAADLAGEVILVNFDRDADPVPGLPVYDW